MTREKFIQLIHIARRELALDDDTWRAMLMSITGETSTRKMGFIQLSDILETLKRRGFRVRSSGVRSQASYPQAKKLRALWRDMHAQGIVRDSTDAALCAWLKRETGIDRIEWLQPPQASRAIEKLKKWQARTGGQ